MSVLLAGRRRWVGSHRRQAASVAVCVIAQFIAWNLPTAAAAQTVCAQGRGCEDWVAVHEWNVSGTGFARSIALDPARGSVYAAGGYGPSFFDGNMETVAYPADDGDEGIFGDEIDEQWIATHDAGPDAENDRAWDVATSPTDGSVFMVGDVKSSTHNYTDWGVVSLNPSGQKRWTSIYQAPPIQGEFHDVHSAKAVAVSPDGETIYVGGRTPQRSLSGDYTTIAYDADTGQQLWLAYYNGTLSAFDEIREVLVSPDGTRVYVSGESWGRNTSFDLVTIAYDAATGQQLWLQSYDGGSGRELFGGAELSPDGSRLFVTGGSIHESTAEDYATIAYNTATGVQIWAARYDRLLVDGLQPGESEDTQARTDQSRGLAVDSTGRFVAVTGRSALAGFDIATVLYDATDGDLIWSRRFQGNYPNGEDVGNAVAFSAGGTEVIAAGMATHPTTSPQRNADLVTLWYSTETGASTRVAQWDGVSAEDEAEAVIVDPVGRYVYVTGRTLYSTNAGLSSTAQFVTLAYETTPDVEPSPTPTGSASPTSTPTSSATPTPSSTPTRSAVAWRNLDKRVHPPGSFAGSMVYDEARSEMVLFGGATTTVDPVGTWLNDGTGWRRAPVSFEPASRYGATMVYDAASQQAILFGGYVYDEPSGRNRPVDETWAWNGHSWTELSPAGSPSPRAFASAAYDPVEDEVVLFGGVGPDASGALEELGDTWTFDGSTWTQESTTSAPSRRHSPGMTFHLGRGVVLFGGWGPGTGVPCTTTVAGICFKLDPTARGDDGIKADTWIWKDGGWTEVATSSAPAKRGGMGMAYDPLSARTILFGGVNISGSFDDTWAFDGTDWVEITPEESPERRFDPVMAADPDRGVVLFGGHRSTYMGSDTWVFAENEWVSADVPTPKPRFGPSLVYDDARGRMVMFGGDADDVFSDTWVYGDAWERLSPAVSPPGRAQAGEAFDSARGEFVVFGGQGPEAEDLGDTWTFDGTTWTEHTASLPDLTPLARRGPAMVYDPVRQETVMFGGLNIDIGTLADTWTWDGTAWTPKVGITSPPAVESAAMTFDPERRQVVLFGGIDDGNQLRDETWLWDGASWTKANPATVPPARLAAAMTYMPELGAVVMMGGIGGGEGLWLWDGTDWERIEIADGPAKRSWAGFAYGADVGGAFLFGGVAQGYRSDTWLLGRAPSPSPSPSLSPQPDITTVAFTDRSSGSGQHSDQTSFEARLVDSSGDPAANAELTFEFTGDESSRTFTAVTDDDGVAFVTPTLEEKPGAYQLTVRFAGDADHEGSSDTTNFVVDKEDTDLELTVEGNGNKRTLTARLSDRDTPTDGIAGRTIDFYADGELIGSATTDEDGVAILKPPPRYRGGKHDFEASFAGDDYYVVSWDRRQS